jgi:hypothetical protein
MPTFIQKADVKQLVIWLFLSNLFLIGVICSGAVWIHNSAISDIKSELTEAKTERKQIIANVHKIDIKVARISK